MLIPNYPNARDISHLVNKDKVFDFCHCLAFNSCQLPPKNSDFLTIIGSGADVKADIKTWGIHGDVTTVNFATLFFHKDFDHMVSYHADVFKYVIELRKLAVETKPFFVHTGGQLTRRVKDNANIIHYLWSFKPEPRSSGLLALWIGVALGYKKILLLGLPLDKSGRFTDMVDEDARNVYYEESALITNKKLNFNKLKNVRSASGNTAKLFGYPDAEWLRKK